MITLSPELTEEQVQALAQFVKRVTWTGLRECAVDDEEAYTMRDAIDQVRKDLAEKGFCPR